MIKLTVKTDQEAFDKVWAHLHSMPKQAMSPNRRCAYYGTAGATCAIGCLMDRPENLSENFLPIRILVYDGQLDVGTVNIDMLQCLQTIHDTPSNWGANGFIADHELQRVAHDFLLQVPGVTDACPGNR